MYDIFKAAVMYEGKLNASNSLVKRTTYFVDPCFKFRFENWQTCVIIVLKTHTYRVQQMQIYELSKKKLQYLPATGTNF